MMPSKTPPRWVGSSSTTSEIRYIAGNAQMMPMTASVDGRSPVASPTTTGTRAHPTAESGATTPIRAPASPRYRNTAPMPAHTPASAPHRQSLASG